MVCIKILFSYTHSVSRDILRVLVFTRLNWVVFRLVKENVLWLWVQACEFGPSRPLMCCQHTWHLFPLSQKSGSESFSSQPGTYQGTRVGSGDETSLLSLVCRLWNRGVCERRGSRRNICPPEIASSLKKQVKKHEKPCGGWGLIVGRSSFGFSSRCFCEDGSNHQYSWVVSMQSHPVGTENAVEDRLKWFSTFDFSTNTYLKSV